MEHLASHAVGLGFRQTNTSVQTKLQISFKKSRAFFEILCTIAYGMVFSFYMSTQTIMFEL